MNKSIRCFKICYRNSSIEFGIRKSIYEQSYPGIFPISLISFPPQNIVFSIYIRTNVSFSAYVHPVKTKNAFLFFWRRKTILYRTPPPLTLSQFSFTSFYYLTEIILDLSNVHVHELSCICHFIHQWIVQS